MYKEKTSNRNLRLVTLNLDWDDVKEYKEILNTDLSKAIRQLIREQLDETKKVEAPTRLPILTSKVRQTTLSEYVEQAIKTIRETSDDEIIEFARKDRLLNIDAIREVRQKLHLILVNRFHYTLTRDEQRGVVKYR